MKYRYFPSLLTGLLSLATGVVYAEPLTGCAAKKMEIKKQISFALEHNNTHQLDGLNKALREMDMNCTDEKLRQQRNEKITEKLKKVAKRQAELEQARETGNIKKIVQKQKKLEQARSELQNAQEALSQ